MTDQPTDGMLLLLDEALQLRHGVQVEGAVGDQHQILDTLMAVRVRVDRVEELLNRAMITRGVIARASSHAKASTAEAWDRAVIKQRKGPVSLDSDYLGARERYAMANLETLELRREEQKLGESQSLADQIVEQIRITYRGLTDLRQDLLTMLRAAQFETTLDR